MWFNAAKWVAVGMLFLVAGCATNKAVPVAEPTVRTIEVIPVANPSWYSLKNRNALELTVSPLIGGGVALNSRQKAGLFTDTMKGQQYPLGANMTRVLVEELNRQGFTARVMAEVPMDPEDPEAIDFEKIKSDADAVLVVSYQDIGVYSGYTSLQYLPRINLSGYLMNPKNGETIHEEVVYYGVDSREGKSWGIPADPEFAYRSFDDLMSNASEIMRRFDAGSQIGAKRMVENFRAALR